MSDSVADNRKNFISWLEYNKPGKVASGIKSLIGILDVLLIKSGVIHSHILKIDDAGEIETVVENIKKSKGIRIHSKNRRSIALNALYTYKEYLESFALEKKIDCDATGGDDVKTVSFTENGNYSYTRPSSVEYFGELYPMSNWTALYVQTVKCLLRDYPDSIKNLNSQNIGSRGRIDITDAAGMQNMIAPKEIGAGLYLETNCSASRIIDKIKQFMDRCGVDYDSIVIIYAEIGSSYAETLPSQENGKIADKMPVTKFLTWLTSLEGLAMPTGRSYASAIKNCDYLCRKHNIGTGKLYGAKTAEELERNIDLLLTNEEFLNYNRVQHNRFTAALSKYKKYLGLQDGGTALVQPTARHNDVTIDAEEDIRIRKTLELPWFEYGFKDDSVELYRFCTSYEQVNGENCPLSDEQLFAAIRQIGFEFDGKVYLVPEDEKERLLEDLRSYKACGVNIIYYKCLYDLNSIEYFDAKIVSAEMLKTLLKKLAPGYRYKANYLALSPQKQTELELIESEIIRVWGGNALKTVNKLSIELPLIPIDKLKFALAQRSVFIWNSIETYTRKDLFYADDEEIESLTGYIEEQCDKLGRVSYDDIPLDALRENNPELSETALCNAFYKLIEDQFDRNAKILTKKGASKDTYTAVMEFCRTQDKCTYERLERIAEMVAGVVRHPAVVDAANATMVRVNKDNFVADRFVRFDVDRIDAALDKIVVSDFMGMKEITTFSIFPFCGYSWNLYLLESYCRRFSKKYRYDTRRSNSSNSGAVVSKSCLLSYHDIMAYAVARSGMELSEKEVYAYLTETGYMERKRYRKIDSLINEAAELRERWK